MREVHNELEAIRQEERNICNLDGMTGNLDKSESDNIHLYVYVWRLYLLCFSPFLHNAPFTLFFKSGMLVYCQNAISAIDISSARNIACEKASVYIEIEACVVIV